MSIASKIENGRAEFSYLCAMEGKKLGNKAKEYKSHIKSLPMIIHTNGLGATIAFVFSKSKVETYEMIYNQLKKWFVLKKYMEEDDDFVKIIISADSYKYRLYTLEVIALCGWIKRFAEGMIDDKNEKTQKEVMFSGDGNN
ncbi:MAG TPA: type III-B CRISPR module-associated protein Cmr5 [Pseudobacteroides sp.]|nr:type III-B CRISPR module-associated protein Cmr5 [Pseudobacteroides sp.]